MAKARVSKKVFIWASINYYYRYLILLWSGDKCEILATTSNSLEELGRGRIWAVSEGVKISA